MAKKGRKASTAGQNRWEAALMQCPFEEVSFKGALNPNFLNFTINREKFCL